LTFNGLHGFISQKTELFNELLVIHSFMLYATSYWLNRP
jgi:hypothetical protein